MLLMMGQDMMLARRSYLELSLLATVSGLLQLGEIAKACMRSAKKQLSLRRILWTSLLLEVSLKKK